MFKININQGKEISIWVQDATLLHYQCIKQGMA